MKLSHLILIVLSPCCFLFVPEQLSAAGIEGKWLQHVPKPKVKMAEREGSNFGGWQTSDLTFHAGTRTFWSIGDQNCTTMHEQSPTISPDQYRFLYRIQFNQNKQPEAEPIPISWAQTPKEFAEVSESFRVTNSEGKEAPLSRIIDFEGLTIVPNPDKQSKQITFLACTEGETPWLVEIQYEEGGNKAEVTRVVRISRDGNHENQPPFIGKEPARNKRWEGIVVSPHGDMIYLVTEWADSPARIYQIPMNQVRGDKALPKVTPKPFVIDKKKKMSGELTGICWHPWNGKDYLVALERNNARLFFIDPKAPEKDPLEVSLDLRGPDGIYIKSASPEGIASDGQEFVIIGDPAANFFHAKDQNQNGANFRKLIPLVFEVRLSQ